MSAPANSCDCSACVGACLHKPGWFKPDQILPLAQAMGITEQELFDKHLMVDYWDGTVETDYKDVFVLSPAITRGTPGEEFGRDPKGRCRWLQEGKCAIHTLGKPFECAAYHHSQEAPSGAHMEVALAWNTPEHQAKIQELLGREPETAGTWSILDEMGLGGFL